MTEGPIAPPAAQSTEGLFSTKRPTFQLSWDATSLTTFQTCPRKYQLSMIDGWRPKAPAAPLLFGGFLHAGMEHVDKLLHAGMDRVAAVEAGVRFLLEQTTTRWLEHATHNGQDLDWSRVRELTADEVYEPEPTVERIVSVPWESGDNLRTRAKLVEALVNYYEQYNPDPLETVELAGKPAIELSFSFQLPFPSLEGEPLMWCGHMDKLVRFGQSTLVLERKHTKTTVGSYYFDQYLMSDQILGYVLAGQIVFSAKVDGAIVEATQIAQTFTRTHRSPQYRTEEHMAEWLHNLRYWLGLAEHYATINFWPMNRASCNNYGGCPFRQVCSLHPALREDQLKTYYHIDRWDPLKVRGD